MSECLQFVCLVILFEIPHICDIINIAIFRDGLSIKQCMYCLKRYKTQYTIIMLLNHLSYLILQ